MGNPPYSSRQRHLNQRSVFISESVSITVDVKQTVSDLKTVNDKLADVRQKTITIPPSNLFTHMGGTIKEAWRALTDFHGSAKRLIALIGGRWRAVGVFAAAIFALVKVYNWVLDQIDRVKDAYAKLSLTNAQSIREVAEANDAARQKTDGYMSKLGELANAEKLSNEQKAEALRLIAALGKNYRNLGVEIDAATGKLVGFDEAMIKKRDKIASGSCGRSTRNSRTSPPMTQSSVKN